MTTPDIHVHADLEALSQAAAGEFASLAERAVWRGGQFSVALSGGSTPRRLCEILGASYAEKVPWGKVHLFQVDERGVPPDQTASNFRMIQEALLSRLSIPTENIHRMEGERDLEEAARNYAGVLASNIPARHGDFPCFDSIYLGMGADGHTASLFPGSELLAAKTDWVGVSEPGPEGLNRLTLTLPVLAAAARIIFLVSGTEKAETLARVLSPRTGASLPAGLVAQSGVPVTWHLDRAAAEKLSLG